MTGSSLFDHLKIILILKKIKCVSGNRTRDVLAEGLDDRHYAIKSLNKTESNWSIMFFRMTENVIYFTIYGKLVLTRKRKIYQKFLLLDFDKTKYITNFTWGLNVLSAQNDSSATRWPHRTSYDLAYS